MNLPVYRAIALDIAKRIVNQEFLEGAKISGRTLFIKGNPSAGTDRIQKFSLRICCTSEPAKRLFTV